MAHQLESPGNAHVSGLFFTFSTPQRRPIASRYLNDSGLGPPLALRTSGRVTTYPGKRYQKLKGGSFPLIYLIGFGVVVLVIIGLANMRGPNIGLRGRMSEDRADRMVDAAFRDPNHFD